MGTQYDRGGEIDINGLLLLAASRPQEALANARALLAARPSPADASVAHQAAGVVLRDFGDVDAAIGELRAALRLARRSGIADRETDVLATLGASLVYAGHTARGLTALDLAARQAGGVLAGRVRLRRGIALSIVGRNREALADLSQSAAVLRRAGDSIWEARALTARAGVHLAFGSTQRADADFSTAERLFAKTSQELETAYAIHNRGLVAFRSGDLPAALAVLDEAQHRYRQLDLVEPDLSIDRCGVLLAAGLSADALGEADLAIMHLRRTRGQPTKRAELLLLAASAALDGSDPQTALLRARDAQRLFAAQDRDWWRVHAQFLVVKASYATGVASATLLRSATATAVRLEKLGSVDAARAHLLAGQLALAVQRWPDATAHLTAAARGRRRGTAMSRATGWLAQALLAETAGQPRRLLGACRSGLNVLDEHRLTLGAAELRAQATAHGAQLAMLAQRHAVRTASPRLLLTWSERWRATALAVPPVRPPDDRELGADLAALRYVTSRLDKARAGEAPTTMLVREQLRLEAAVRGRTLRTPGAARAGHALVDIDALLRELGPGQLLQVVDVDGTLYVLVCGAGRVRRLVAGRSQEAARETEFVRSGLRRLARQNSPQDRRSTAAILDAGGRKLEAALLGQAARQLGDGPLVIVPPARFHAVPWALLPSLRDRAISIAPSAAAWLRARAIDPPPSRRVTVVCGPGLDAARAEAPAVAAMYSASTAAASTAAGSTDAAGAYQDVTLLQDGDATAGQVLDAIDGAWLAHIAAHGTFRADSPLFSSLRMADGPLTVYDFERLRRAPYRLVLPSCDSGLMAPAGADELLGLVSSLLPQGTAGILASVVPLNDSAAAELMPQLHRWLAAGRTLAESLPALRRDLGNDPLLVGTGCSLVALGAA
jgi:CHAT domain-containing protein